VLDTRVHYVHSADGFRLAITEVFDRVSPAEAGAPTFLLVHGFAQNRSAFTCGVIPAALTGHGGRVLIGELRGHGLSSPAGAPRTWTLATHLRQDLPALIRSARTIGGVDRIHLFGHSMGGLLGYALLSRSHRLASLVTFAAPLVLGSGRPAIRLAARLFPPLFRAARSHHVPMDQILRIVAPHATRPVARGLRGLLRETIRLANPALAEPERLHDVLSTADAEARAVLLELATFAATGRAEIDGTVLADAVRMSPLPVAAVLGTRDVFADERSLDPVLAGPGPRRLVLVEDAGHVDITMGTAAAEVVADLWMFLTDGLSAE